MLAVLAVCVEWAGALYEYRQRRETYYEAVDCAWRYGVDVADLLPDGRIPVAV